ncbi:MAG: hypothetical protein QOE36_3016 [Gaiellaceae bacterium]|jgi:transcriptional regulator with XRE-family HTH domain|nr:hypothetical protein [Gaiellaceae bacterium]
MENTTQSESIGQRLRRLRLERGLSQRELAAPGVSYAYISRIEAGTRQPSVKALRKLARKLGISPEYLETGSDFGDAQKRELELTDAELELRLADDPGQVEGTFERLLSEAIEAGDTTTATRARISLGLVAAHLGRHDRAVEQLEAAIGDEIDPASRPDAYAALGRSYAVLGHPERAVELFERCLSTLQDGAPDDKAAHARFASYLSAALSDMGELERARKVVETALEETGGLADPYTQVRLYWSIARVLTMQGRQTAALDYSRRAIALLEASEDTIQLGRAHLIAASIANKVEEPSRAEGHLDMAERLLGRSPDRNDVASLRSEQAKHAAGEGDGNAAITLARESLLLLDDEDPAEQGGALFALARGLSLNGETKEAVGAFSRSVDLLNGQGRWDEAERASRAWADMLDAAGQKDEAASIRERAESFGRQANRASRTPARR